MAWTDGTMLSIGDLARRTGVSTRMLRHWDALGLVRPVSVDETTGYRRYATSQVGRVEAVVTLRELGFSLAQCGTLLDDQLGARDLAGVLALRRDELAGRIAADTRRLAEVRRRLRSIEEGRTMTLRDLRLAPLPELSVVQARTQVAGTTGIGGAIEPLAEATEEAIALLSLDPGPRRLHTFYGCLDSESVEVAVAAVLPAGAEIDPARLAGLPEGVEIARIPGVARGAKVELSGDDLGVGDAWRLLDDALADRGLVSYGLYRRVLWAADRAGARPPDAHDTAAVMAELQCPVREGDEICSPDAHAATRSTRPSDQSPPAVTKSMSSSIRPSSAGSRSR